MTAAKSKTAAQKNRSFNAANDVDSFTGRKRVRRFFGKGLEVAEMPNLIGVQRESQHYFLQPDVPAGERKMQGLHKVLTEVFPIKDFSDRAEIDYVSYELEEPKYDVEECIQRDMTYAAPL
ncbi:MAG: hypothetical protein KDJ15_05635, partial [Alphaproteobacteria bacterium]|nr:hypothetical protein [Alphaproteobacteria bacterium]